MRDILSIFIFVIITIFAYKYPTKLGWFALFAVSLLAPTGLTIMGSETIPLTISRVGYAILIGIIIKANLQKFDIKKTLRIPFVRYYLLFAIFITIISFSYNPKNIIFTYIPSTIYIIFISFIIVDSEKKIIRLAEIYVIISIIVSISIILEYHTTINLSLMIERTIPGVNEFGKYSQSKSGLNEIFRFNEYRPGGLWRNSVNTGYLLAFLFPFTIWYGSRGKFELAMLIKLIPLFVILYSTYLLKTRVVFIAMFLALIIIMLYLITYMRKKVYFQKALFIFGGGIALAGIALGFSSGISSSLVSYVNSISQSLEYGSDIALEARFYWASQSLAIGMASPLWGHLVSPFYVYFELMSTNDLPGIFIYFISGGLILVTLYIFMLGSILIGTLKIVKRRIINHEARYLLFFVQSGFASGLFVLLSNRVEEHLPMMMMMFISIYNVYSLNRANDSGNNVSGTEEV